MTVLQAFKSLGAAVLDLAIPAVEARKAPILAWGHEAISAPISVQIGEVIEASIPEIKILDWDLSGIIVSKIPQFETQLTQALDGKLGLAFDWGIGAAQRLSAKLG
jgi:hypothetical protein